MGPSLCSGLPCTVWNGAPPADWCVFKQTTPGICQHLHKTGPPGVGKSLSFPYTGLHAMQQNRGCSFRAQKTQ